MKARNIPPRPNSDTKPTAYGIPIPPRPPERPPTRYVSEDYVDSNPIQPLYIRIAHAVACVMLGYGIGVLSTYIWS